MRTLGSFELEKDLNAIKVAVKEKKRSSTHFSSDFTPLPPSTCVSEGYIKAPKLEGNLPRDHNFCNTSFLGEAFHRKDAVVAGKYDTSSPFLKASISKTRNSTFNRRFRDTRPLMGSAADSSLYGLDNIFVEHGPEPGAYEFPADTF